VQLLRELVPTATRSAGLFDMTAKALGLKIPLSLLQPADQVIE